jgi:hypothetical protein
MELRREVTVSIGLLVAFNALLALGAIGLLGRMAPAIEQILEDNVVSLEAAEHMLAVVARSGGGPVSASEQQAFRQALAAAKGNITEVLEVPALGRIEAAADLALAGDPARSTEVIQALLDLIEINRAAMRTADDDAKRLGTAGAWAAVFIALALFASSLAVARRLQTHLLAPLVELHETLLARRGGDRFRRARIDHAPIEIRQIMLETNALLDAVSKAAEAPAPRGSQWDRTVALTLLDSREAPAMVFRSDGTLLAANAAADAVTAADATPKALFDALRQGTQTEGWRIRRLGSEDAYLVERT